MLRLKFSIELNYEIDQPGCDFVFSIHAAQTPHQIVVGESLNISQSLPSNMYTDPVTHTRFLRLKAFAGLLTVRYDATVDLDHHTAQPSQLGEVAVANLPGPRCPTSTPADIVSLTGCTDWRSRSLGNCSRVMAVFRPSATG